MSEVPLQPDAHEASLRLAQVEQRLLQETILSLRQALEVSAAETERQVQYALATLTSENSQLRATVSELRQALESARDREEQAANRAAFELSTASRRMKSDGTRSAADPTSPSVRLVA
jgi:LPS O-antigen subunit length determinant protein (WzzB/FepE family)